MEFSHPLHVRRAKKRLLDGWRIELLPVEWSELQETSTQEFSYETVEILCRYVGENVDSVDSMCVLFYLNMKLDPVMLIRQFH